MKKQEIVAGQNLVKDQIEILSVSRQGSTSRIEDPASIYEQKNLGKPVLSKSRNGIKQAQTQVKEGNTGQL